MRLSRSILSFIVLVGVVACSDTSGPKVETSYYLRNVNGEPLPFVMSASGSDTLTIIGARFALADDATAMLTSSYRAVTSGRAPDTSEAAGRYTYTRSGDTLVFTPQCPPTALALCVGPSWGTLAGEVLQLKGYVVAGPNGPVYAEMGPRFEFVLLLLD